MTPMESMVLRNVLSNTRSVGVTPENKVEHDAAVIALIQRGYIRYRPQRARQRFSLTWQGREALAEYERAATVNALATLSGPTAEVAWSIVVAASDDDVLLIAERGK